ncbi:hypothetical protein SPBR_01441 [Sporothrix brasiliensis 5110]|uniref:TLDc domain-containing protein n=1 Tax=Sporothrix brasiliensis 5110 TaxID=1398154 RepID=A0A0C2EZ82_9PEZI|nr:uncharacterized protein SPBR_01441 [Sporothrix brasiliensis 5110]KIH91809.1 hypothetical protein SPBR_01441 [Sporothrix brasiliensis 5110]
MAMALWDDIQGYVLFPLGIFVLSLWHALGHPIETFYVLLSPFNPQYYFHHLDFRVDRYYARLTRARMQSDLRSALVSTFYNKDAIITELDKAVSRWRRWCLQDRGPLYALFDEFAVKMVEARTGRKVKVWTDDRFAAFIASRLGSDDSGVAPILWRTFCYSARYPFTASIDTCPAEEQQLNLHDWVQAVAMLATDAADNVHYARPMYSVTGSSIWYGFASMAVKLKLGRSRPQHHSVDDVDNADEEAPTVLTQVALVASTQLPLDYAMRGPKLPEILPHVRKLVTDEECEPVFKADFGIPYHDLVCLLGATLQVDKPDLEAARWTGRLDENRGLGLATTTEIDRATHFAVAKQILAAAGLHDEERGGDAVVSYKQYEALWLRLCLQPVDRFHHNERRSFDREMDLLWRSLFSVFSVPQDLKGLNHDRCGRDQTPERPPPPLVLQALDFLYPFPSCGYTRQERRSNTLVYSSEDTAETGGMSGDGVMAALTSHYVPMLVIVYGRTTDASRQPAIFAVFTSSPLWTSARRGQTGMQFFVDDKHLLMEIAPRARVLQYQPPKNKESKTRFTDLVTTDDVADTICFGSRSGLTLNFASGVATLFSAAEAADATDAGHYIEIPAGPYTTDRGPIASPAAWTTSMHITKLEVYRGIDGIDEDLVIRRDLRSNRRRSAAEGQRG